MKELSIHEIDFKSDAHYNLFLFAKQLQLNVADPSYYAEVELPWQDCYKVSLGDKNFYIKRDIYNKFKLALGRREEPEIEIYLHMAASEEDEDRAVRVRHAINFGDRQFSTESADGFYELESQDFIDTESRISGLMRVVTDSIRTIAKLANEEMNVVALDGNVVKDFDGIMTFNSPLGRDVNLHLCFDKLPPIHDDQESIVIERTPITPEDLATYFPNVGKKIVGHLDHLNDALRVMFRSKRIAGSEYLTRYVENLVNHVFLKSFFDQNVNFVSFGGRDDWSSNGKDTPNNMACFKLLDQEVDKIFKMLEAIPLEEGVEVYSLDLDTFAVFGRKDNKVVTPALQGITGPLLATYSQGFERVLTIRLSLLDTPHVFKA